MHKVVTSHPLVRVTSENIYRLKSTTSLQLGMLHFPWRQVHTARTILAELNSICEPCQAEPEKLCKAEKHFHADLILLTPREADEDDPPARPNETASRYCSRTATCVHCTASCMSSAFFLPSTSGVLRLSSGPRPSSTRPAHRGAIHP